MSDRRDEEGPHGGHGPADWARGDTRLAEAVSEALSEDRLLDARGIEVSVADGVVTLSGTVSGHAGVLLAENLARRAGAAQVRTDLNVVKRPPPEAEDDGQGGLDPLPPFIP